MTTQFLYSLSKKGKHNCPNCGKKTFVLYVENETGNNMPDNFGRCDREQNCAYHAYPDDNKPIFIPKHEIQEIKTDYIDYQVFERMNFTYKNCNLLEFLLSKFDYSKVNQIFKDYFLSEIDTNTIFWQIDQLERIRSGKIMAYDLVTGKRKKDANGKAMINWVHKKPFNLKQCLFGLHLTLEDRRKTIAIVESEKTAIIMAICEPNFLWMACGSKSGFKLEYLAVLKFRKIIAFPDKGCFDDWNLVAENLNKLGFDITVVDFLENSDYEIGSDVADEYLKI